jgi:hypothetical protein
VVCIQRPFRKSESILKPKVKNWIDLLRKGIVETNITRVLYQVHKHTKQSGFTNVNDLRSELNIAHQTLTSVLSHVQDEGLIDMYGELEIKGIKYQKIRYAHPTERDDLIRKRQLEKFLAWLNKMNDYNDFLDKDVKNALKRLKTNLE